jgi:hypothetical protein
MDNWTDLPAGTLVITPCGRVRKGADGLGYFETVTDPEAAARAYPGTFADWQAGRTWQAVSARQ